MSEREPIVVDIPHRDTSEKPELLSVILSALTCAGHFGKQTIWDHETGKKVTDGSVVICKQCVDRMRKALDLKDDEPVPSHFQYGLWTDDEERLFLVHPQ